MAWVEHIGEDNDVMAVTNCSPAPPPRLSILQASVAAQLHWACLWLSTGQPLTVDPQSSWDSTVADLDPAKEIQTSTEQWGSLILSTTRVWVAGIQLALIMLWWIMLSSTLATEYVFLMLQKTWVTKHWGKASKKSRMSAVCYLLKYVNRWKESM